jgi:hypothetical protein
MALTARPHTGRRSSPTTAKGVSLLLTVVLATALTACGSSADQSPSAQTSQPPLGFRSLPRFLPKTTAPVDRVVTATPSHPQLAVQGIGVETELDDGHALATVTGPRVPPFVSPPPPAVTATFQVSFAHVIGTIPLRLADFTITDQLGRTFHPSLVAHEKSPPATLSTGHDLTFRVNAVMPTGEGRVYWTPTGSAPLVSWDFVVEND